MNAGIFFRRDKFPERSEIRPRFGGNMSPSMGTRVGKLGDNSHPPGGRGEKVKFPALSLWGSIFAKTGDAAISCRGGRMGLHKTRHRAAVFTSDGAGLN